MFKPPCKLLAAVFAAEVVAGASATTLPVTEPTADETVLEELSLATDGVGEVLRARTEVGEVGTCEKGNSKPEKRKSMLSSGDSK